MAQTIALKGGFERKEGVASSAITPGELVERGGSDDYQAHSTAGGTAQKSFALENDLVGDSISDDYDAGDTVQVGVFERGAEVQAIASAAITKGDILESDGAGRVQTQAASAATSEAERDSVVGQALEAAASAGDLIEIEVF